MAAHRKYSLELEGKAIRMVADGHTKAEVIKATGYSGRQLENIIYGCGMKFTRAAVSADRSDVRPAPVDAPEIWQQLLYTNKPPGSRA